MNCTALAARPTVQPLRGELRHAETLVRMVASSGRLMAALRYVRSLELRSWCIGAGLVRNLVWDALHGFDPSVPADVDVAHFDAHMPSQLDGALERRLRVLMPGLNWEVTNQAHVHRWFEADLGRIVPPLTSLDDGISTWPEFATCVGVNLAADDSIQVIAPHGLDDLFELRVRHNASRASTDEFTERVRSRRFQERWPRLTLCAPALPRPTRIG